ncbi:MAG: type II toxin-antitoxin system VapC family toxin [Verrucomicrobiales bacterium]
MVIDSHVLYWWLDGFPRLSKKADEVLRESHAGGNPLLVAPVTFWELSDKERRGRFSSRRPVSEWPTLIAKVPWMEIVDTDSSIWIAAAALDWSHRDPADRLIAATALARGVPVLTKDRVFHRKGSPVAAVW